MSQDPRKLVVNATPLLSNLTGVGQVTFEISKRLSLCLEYQTEFFTPYRTYPTLDALKGHIDNHLHRQFRAVLKNVPFKKALRQIYSRTRSAGYEEPCDLYWEPNYIPLDSIHAKTRVATVYDMSVKDHPEWHPQDRVWFHNEHFSRSLSRVDIVTTISEFSRQRILELERGIRADQVRVIPCGINHDVFRVLSDEAVESFRKKNGLPQAFILFVGTVEPRKNLIHLLKSYERLPADCREHYPLVLVGDKGWENREIIGQIKKLGQLVIKTGYMQSQQDLALMYNAASVFVFPSLYEGFGIPPLEAMACGTPVCLSAIPVFHEIYGDDAACYGNPADVESFADALQKVLSNAEFRTRLSDRGFQIAQKYTWDTAFDGYLSVFKELMQ